MRVLVTFGFGELGLHRVSAAIGPDNAASVAVVRQAGFSYEGRIRDHAHTNGAWRDSLLYSASSGRDIARRTCSAGLGGLMRGRSDAAEQGREGEDHDPRPRRVHRQIAGLPAFEGRERGASAGQAQ